MDISISDSFKAWIDAQVEAGSFEDASAYVTDLVQRDLTSRADLQALSAALAAGEESGLSPRRVPDIMAALRAEVGGGG